MLTAVLAGCGSGAGDTLDAADATMCRELGGDLVYIRYETDASGTESRLQPGLDYEQAQSSTGLSESARQVLEIRGWDEEALRQLNGEQELTAPTEAMLDSMPSCLDTLRARTGNE